MGLRRFKSLSAAVILVFIAMISLAVSAAPGAKDSCRADYGKIAEFGKETSSEEAARLRSMLRQALFESPADPHEDLFHEFGRSRGGLHTVNGLKITGADHYPLLSIKKNLKLTEDYMFTLPTKAKVLSVGEGTSELAENLRMKFPDTKALDLWYDDPNLPKDLADFVAKNRPHLIAGSAMRMPVESRSIDLVVSHMLLGNLDPASRLKSLGEMIRVLKVGGEARIAFADVERADLAKTLKQFYGDEITVVSERWDSNWTGMVNHPCQTLYIRRVKNGRPDN